jgi:hypothetical protein
VAAGPILVALAVDRDHLALFASFGIGAGLGMAVAVALSPPPHIERWREGAEGERATAKALRPLTKAGWVLVHDMQTDRGNIDHVLVGPPGVFMLETKKLGGLVSVCDDKLQVRWRDAPDDGYALRERARWRVRSRTATGGSEPIAAQMEASVLGLFARGAQGQRMSCQRHKRAGHFFSMPIDKQLPADRRAAA